MAKEISKNVACFMRQIKVTQYFVLIYLFRRCLDRRYTIHSLQKERTSCRSKICLESSVSSQLQCFVLKLPTEEAFQIGFSLKFCVNQLEKAVSEQKSPAFLRPVENKR